MRALGIKAIPVLKDNYIWVLHAGQQALVVDPGVTEPVREYLHEAKLNLSALLITHRHWDHTDGIPGLLEAFPGTPVYGSVQDAIPLLSHPLSGDEELDLPGFPKIKVLALPGHTKGHIAYLLEQALFCGDTLFAAGCGRVFDGTYEELYQSLTKLAALQASTKIYSAHEYTLNNLKFAQVLEPANLSIQKRMRAAETLRAQGLPTLPSSLALEQQTNPFLRLHVKALQETLARHLGAIPHNEFEAFKALRNWKDKFC